LHVSPQQQHTLSQIRPTNPHAFQDYLQGRQYWATRSEQGLHKAIEFFNRAIEEDPGDARSYAGLAHCYIVFPLLYNVPHLDAYAKAREVMPSQLAEILAEIHRIDPVKHKLDFLPKADADAALAEVKQYEATFRRLALEPHPSFELAFRWLLSRVPKTPRNTLVHGDYRIGNVIFGPEGV
jgi:hypothetical protein